MKNLYISSDHGGYVLKIEIMHKLKDKIGDFVFQDLGPYEMNEEDDYPDYAARVCNKVLGEKDSIGILICRSGIGMSIAANKYKGIYAALCFNEKHAEMARKHNNANVLCLDSDYSDKDLHYRIIQNFLATEFEGAETRHGRRVKKIREIEDKN